MADATPAQIAAAERAMDGLEAQADIWADEVDLVLMIKNVVSPMRLSRNAPNDVREKFTARMEAQIDAIVRQAYLEGFYRGGESRKEYDAGRTALKAGERKDG